MINFDNIENSLRHEIADDNGDVSCDLTNTALQELITRLRQAEKDAARYRWLRDESWGCDKAPALPKVMSGRRNQEIVLAEKAMDSAIDEAMQCN